VAGNVFQNSDPAAQAWLVEAFTAIDALCAIVISAGQTVTSTKGQAPLAGAAGFSIVEALCACGFQSAADISALTQADFTQAVVGTPAFALAGKIYTAAITISPSPPAPQPGQPGFHPINPDGSLTDCIPPESLSPLGPVAYLADLLTLSEAATCENPSPATGTTLGDAVKTRRGPLANLTASAANLATPLPLVDLVNECLESMVATATPVGTVYDTAPDKLAGFTLCQRDDCAPECDDCASESKAKAEHCHDPARIFAALPEHSTPADPTAANSGVEPAAYTKLKSDFSTPLLPYSQPLDVNRSILRHFGSCRFETMRSFRRCITEFVFAPANDPLGFDDYVWRLPVRIDIAIEYLGITPEEYAQLFHGTAAPACGRRDVRDDSASAPPPATALPTVGNAVRGEGALQLPVVLADLGLDYCELFSLWQSKFVPFGVTDAQSREREPVALPECEPCCLDRLSIAFPRGADTETERLKLIVFVRLWRKLKEQCCCGYTLEQLSDICAVLQLFTTTGTNPPVTSQNPEFIRQLAAFQMLRDDFHLPLAEQAPAPGVAGVARTPLLALWATPQPPRFAWAVRQLVVGIARHARRRYGCARHAPEFLDHLTSELDELSRLAGFDPTSATDSWHAAPTHTLRFAEILAKLIASPFRPAELRYLFTVDPLPHGQTPFPPQDAHDALVRPLALPEHRHEHSLLALRHRLLEAEVGEEELEHWRWPRVAAELRTAFGFADADVLALGSHFFPRILERAGIHVPASATRFTEPAHRHHARDMEYAAQRAVPIRPRLRRRRAVGDRAARGCGRSGQARRRPRFHRSRADRDPGSLFPAARNARRFRPALSGFPGRRAHAGGGAFGRRALALLPPQRRAVRASSPAHRRAPAAARGRGHRYGSLARRRRGVAAAQRDLCRREFAAAGPELGKPERQPTGGELDAAERRRAGRSARPRRHRARRRVRDRREHGLARYVRRTRRLRPPARPGQLPGPDRAAGVDRDRAPEPVRLRHRAQRAPVRERLQRKARRRQSFTVTWTGALLIEREGHYEFRAGAPRGREHRPDFDAESGAAWRVTLQRGSRSWVLSSRAWPAQEDRRVASHELRPGAYELTIELTQPGPDFTSAAAVRPRHAGLELAYAGPDTDDACVPIPHRRLFAVSKDKPLGDQLSGLSGGAADYLKALYVGSLRDIRRTYQRVFKALLFVTRFALRAEERPNEPSELGYMLAHGANFAGTGFKRPGLVYQKANFDFNFLPVLDDYQPPAGDLRANPSPFRVWAMFDCWERVHDYVVLREDAHRRRGRPWRLFGQAANDPPSDLGSLLREIGAPPSHWPLDLRFYQAHGQPPYAVTDADLEDERWTIRAWRADRWLDAMQRSFRAKDVSGARPDLWADDDPAAITGQVTGNGNLVAFLCESSFALPERTRRYEAVRKLVDGLRLRARDALASYLCANNRTLLPWGTNHYATAPIELSAPLLMDVETGIAGRASRIEEATTAVQTFVRRARLGLEQGWTVGGGFAVGQSVRDVPEMARVQGAPSLQGEPAGMDGASARPANGRVPPAGEAARGRRADGRRARRRRVVAAR
jgi:hypothetical protein